MTVRPALPSGPHLLGPTQVKSSLGGGRLRTAGAQALLVNLGGATDVAALEAAGAQTIARSSLGDLQQALPSCAVPARARARKRVCAAAAVDQHRERSSSTSSRGLAKAVLSRGSETAKTYRFWSRRRRRLVRDDRTGVMRVV